MYGLCLTNTVLAGMWILDHGGEKGSQEALWEVMVASWDHDHGGLV